jgi:DNA modification methylase
MIELHNVDCLEFMKGMEANSVDAIVTDPPYGLSFMGKKWDYEVPGVAVWAECLRVLKPGGHLLAFAGTRTQHRMCVNIEDAGFEIRDMIAWVYGSGFPKSHNIAKAVDREAGERGAVSKRFVAAGGDLPSPDRNYVDPPLVTEAAAQWQGWGTALKPSMEPITVARKPLAGTVASNVLQHGTGAINVDGCRVDAGDGRPHIESMAEKSQHAFGDGLNGSRANGTTTTGRWPANLIHDGSEEVVALFPDVKAGVAVRSNSGGNTFGGDKPKPPMDDMSYGDKGSAARFFYCAKASKEDRDEGLHAIAEKAREGHFGQLRTGTSEAGNTTGTYQARRNHHPTVKPTDLMRYLCRLVTPPGGIVLDPFTGSGSTGKAAILEGFQFVGMEREAEYIPIIKARCAWAVTKRAAEQEVARLKATQTTLFAEPKQRPTPLPQQLTIDPAA